MIDELDAELASSAARAGRTLSWSAAERAIISMAADAIDRRTDLAAAYAETDDVKDRIKISRELKRDRQVAVQDQHRGAGARDAALGQGPQSSQLSLAS